MSDVAIRVESLGKRYRIGAQQRHDTLRDSIVEGVHRLKVGRGKNGNLQPSNLQPSTEFWALKDVSFEVKRGEVVGIIGRNGAGKSTLLKILSRITEPTEGRAEIHGRVGSLLEVGTGFHPELTGRENIFLNGAILGMHRHDIAAKFDEIVAFSEIEKFLDTPVKRYSSGMYVRLAFAVAAHLEPEILLVDEVLAVGDAQFQKKCLGKMGDVARGGRTVLFVSHNMGAVGSLCDRIVLLEGGKVNEIGPTQRVITSYMSEMQSSPLGDLSLLRLPGHGKHVRFSDVFLISSNGRSVLFGSPLQFGLTIQSESTHAGLSIGCSLFTAGGTCVGSLITREEFEIGKDEVLHLRLVVPNSSLAPGPYYAGFSIGSGGYKSNRSDFEVVIGAPAFRILPLSSDEDLITNWSPGWGSIVFSSSALSIEQE